jgi:uncharacterized membrane protein YoaK (UPF0700 family)
VASAPRREARPWWHWLAADPQHGTLPIVLLLMTCVTGVVDAVSILSLGRVFVANMTGNVVFVGFALAGAPGFSVSASLFALAGFLGGALLAGAVIRRIAAGRPVLLRGLAAELCLVGFALLVSVAAGPSLAGGAVNAIAATIAVAMGIQNTVARKLAVPDMTTTVLTLTLTGLVADRPGATSPGAMTRRFLSVAAMFSGAIAGATIVLNSGPSQALALAVGLLLCAAALAFARAEEAGPL